MIKDRVIADANWGSHLHPLITSVMHTNGPILELGCGDFSTPILHALCQPTQRHILSVDSDKTWLNNFQDLERPWHKFMYIPVFEVKKNSNLELWDQVPLDNWSVVLIDNAPIRRRLKDVLRFKDHAQILVVHDYEKINGNIFNDFKYKYIYDRYLTQTILVSNSIDVSEFFK